MRMRFCPVFAAICLIVSSTALGDVIAQKAAPQPARLDRFMFKGRLAAVTFTTKVEPVRTVLSLTFVVDEPYALLTNASPNDEGMARVITDHPAGDLSGLTADNYVATFNGMLPDGVRLGEAFIVTCNQPGAYGLELKTIEPATHESEQRFLAENKAYLLNFRLMMARSRLYAHTARVSMVKRELDGLIVESKKLPDDPTWEKQFAPIIEEQRVKVRNERAEQIAAVALIIEALRNERRDTADEAVQETLDRMISEAEKSLADIRSIVVEESP